MLTSAAVGSGFGLAENLLRFARPGRMVVGNAWDGWWFPVGLGDALAVPGPTQLVTSWIPDGVTARTWLAPTAADAYNTHLILSAVAGLGLALLLIPAPHPSWPTWPLRVGGITAIGFAIADHAAVNAALTAGDLARALVASRRHGQAHGSRRALRPPNLRDTQPLPSGSL